METLSCILQRLMVSSIRLAANRLCGLVDLLLHGSKDSFGESGQLEELKEKYGMNAAAIVKAIKEIL